MKLVLEENDLGIVRKYIPGQIEIRGMWLTSAGIELEAALSGFIGGLLSSFKFRFTVEWVDGNEVDVLVTDITSNKGFIGGIFDFFVNIENKVAEKIAATVNFAELIGENSIKFDLSRFNLPENLLGWSIKEITHQNGTLAVKLDIS